MPLLNGDEHAPPLLHGVASKGSDEWLLVRHTGAVYREYECAPSPQRATCSSAPRQPQTPRRATTPHTEARRCSRRPVWGTETNPLALGSGRRDCESGLVATPRLRCDHVRPPRGHYAHVPAPTPGPSPATSLEARLSHSALRREYLRAINLYRQRVWTCKATGKGGQTYEEALTSETRHATIQQVWEMFQGGEYGPYAGRATPRGREML